MELFPIPSSGWIPSCPDPNRIEGGQLEGQQNFSQLAADTGGAALYEGMFAPGSLTPLLNKLYSILASEAVVTVAAPFPAGKFAAARYQVHPRRHRHLWPGQRRGRQHVAGKK